MANYILPEHTDNIEDIYREVEDIYRPCQQFNDLYIVEYPYSFAFGLERECSTDEVEAINKLSAFVTKYIREKGITFKLMK
jgi:hypothetical protein